jgi:hypothetical protein
MSLLGALGEPKLLASSSLSLSICNIIYINKPLLGKYPRRRIPVTQSPGPLPGAGIQERLDIRSKDPHIQKHAQLLP